MQGSERDPEVIVRRLLQSERHLSTRARDEVLALGTGAVPALLRILDNEVLEGWAPVHAVRLLGEMRISAAIGPMLRALAETDPLDMLRDAILGSLPKIGEPVIEPALRAHAEADDRAFRVNVGSILARIGVLDDRIFAVLLELLEIVQGIRAGKLQYRRNSAHGNPFLRLLRREVEALVKKKHGVEFLKERQTNTELARINHELKRLKLQLAALEERKSQLVAAIGK